MYNKVLITSVGRKVSLVRAFKEAGWVVYGHDLNKDAYALKECHEIYDINEDPRIDLYIPTRDAELVDAYKENGWPTKHLNTCMDKLLFYKWCSANGFKSPDIYFVKPRISKSGKETECVWQEYIDGEEYSVDLFADLSGRVISAVPRVRSLVVGGESVVTTTVKNDAVLKESVTLSNALGLVGHNVLQGFWKDGTMTWTDVNCRYGGASIVGIKAGCESPKWLLEIINGEEVRPRIDEYRIGVTGYSYPEWSIGA